MNRSQPSAEDQILISITNGMNFYFIVTVPLVGALLNLFAALIFRRPALNKTNMGFLFQWQCLIDCGMLLFFALALRGNVLYGVAVESFGDFICRSMTFLRRFVLHLSSWMSVFITFERFSQIVIPNRLKFMQNKFSLNITILIMFVIIAVINVENLFFYLANRNQTNTDNSTSVVNFCTADPQIVNISDLISSLMRTIIPIALMLIMNILTTIALIRSKKRANVKGPRRREINFAVSVIVINILFFVLNTPLAIAYIWSVLGNSSTVEFELASFIRFNFIFWLTVNLSFVYQSLAPIFYIAVNRLYRQQFIQIFTKQRADGLTTQGTTTRPN
nr:G protein-coupled receptor [Proales similis]